MRSSLVQGLIVFLMISLSFSTFGKSEKTPPSHSFLKAFNKLFKSLKDKQAQCNYNDGKCLFIHNPNAQGNSSNDNTFQQCALDLCGPPTPSLAVLSYLDSDVEQLVRSELMKEWEKEFQDSGVEDLIKDWVDKEMASLDHLQKAFLASDMSRKPGFDYLKPEDYSKLADLFFGNYIEIDIDETRPLSKRLIIHTNLPEGASHQLREGLKLYAQDMKRQINASLSEKIDYGIYTHKEAYPILKNKWENFIKRYEEEKKSNDNFGKLYDISGQMIDKRKEMKHLAEQMKSPSVEEYGLRPELLRAAHSMEFLEQSFIQEKTGSWPEEELLCQKKTCQTALNEVAEDLFNQYKKPLRRKHRMDHYLATCLSQFVLMKNLERGVPGGLHIPTVKQHFSDTILKNSSDDTRESFDDYINDDLHIGPIASKSHHFKYSLKNSIELMMASKKETHTDNKSNVELITDMYYEEGALEYADDTPCLSPTHGSTDDSFLIPRTISEAQKKTLPQQEQNILSKGAINLSLFSCLHSQSGQNTVAHEMAHLLSWMFSKNKLSEVSYGHYKKLRECATKRYKKLKAPSEMPFTHENDQKYTEEDTADLVAYMAYPDNKTNFCSILNTLENEEDSEGEDSLLIQYADLSISNSSPSDPHSSSFLRMLLAAIHKRVELSPACKQIVEQYKEDIDFTPCF